VFEMLASEWWSKWWLKPTPPTMAESEPLVNMRVTVQQATLAITPGERT